MEQGAGVANLLAERAQLFGRSVTCSGVPQVTRSLTTPSSVTESSGASFEFLNKIERPAFLSLCTNCLWLKRQGFSSPLPWRCATSASSATKTVLATRQFSGSAGRLAFSQPGTYFHQCDITHCGSRKLAEIGSHPRPAADVTPAGNGSTAVITIGGSGC